MEFNEFSKLIKENAEKGIKTEFFKVQVSIDDYRKSKPSEYGIEETFLANYDKNSRNYVIYYPDSENKITFKNGDMEEEFYNHEWGSYMHK